MASSSPAMKFSLLLLFSLLSYPQTQARDSQLFNKVYPSSASASASATTAVPNQDPPLNNNVQQEQESESEPEPEPSFFPQEKENGYGLYGRESRQQLPRPSTGAAAESGDRPNYRQLPRNYNPVAYLTETEEDDDDKDDEVSYTTTLENYYNDARKKSKQNQLEDEETSEPEQDRSIYNNYQYSGGSSFNSEPQGDAGRNSRGNDGGEESGFRPQGMSDTRYLENGKYFYDIKTEKYSRNHPYAVLNNDERKYYNYGANNENSMSDESYDQNQYEFQNEGNNMP
ncbi:uncharacterized protein [Henckelia pumila]|uniref:uncharacterized protein n=1 Tax=Henckelia pumila TaxID=405737 RepID=UPI003C6DF4FD